MNRIILFLFIVILCGNLTSSSQTLEEQINALSVKLESLHEKLYKCEDPACLTALTKQIDELNVELDKLMARYDKEITSQLNYTGIQAQEIAEISEAEKKAKEKLLGKENDPCYESMFTKELIRQVRGVEPHWVDYYPVVAEVNYDFNAYYQHWWNVREIIKYNSIENMAGCLEIFRQENDMNKITDLKLYTQADTAGKTVQIQNMEATLLAGKYPYNTNKLKTIRTHDPRDFIVKSSTANLFMQYQYDPLSGADVPINSLSLSAASKLPDENRLVKDPFDLISDFYDFQIDDEMRIERVGADAFTVTEILDGIKNGSLSKEFPMNFTYTIPIPQGKKQLEEKFVRNGNVKLNLYFNATPGKLAVMPNEPFNATKFDQKSPFSPDSKTYKLTNTGQMPIQYQLDWNSDWFDASAVKGMIRPNEEKSIVITINENAGLLKEGIHIDKISFKNTSNGLGNTSRDVALDIKNEELWQIKLTGQFTDDMGGKPIVFVGKPAINLNFGVRFDFKVIIEVTIEKKENKWYYKKGIIKSTDVKLSSNFDSDMFDYRNIICLNCDILTNMTGSFVSGELDGKNLRILWPPLTFIARAEWYLKGTHLKEGKQVESIWTHTFFNNSEMFFGIAKDYHFIPLEEGDLPIKPITLRSYKDQFRMKGRKPITIYYRYFRKQIK